MSSLMHKLASNEAVLLMYLADELPDEDRAELEQMLANDDALREQLDALRLLLSTTTLHLDELETANPAPIDENAIRHLLREMRRLRVETAARPHVASPAVRRFPRWVYASASAAAAAFVLIGLWGVGIIDFGPDTLSPPSAMVDSDFESGEMVSVLDERWPFGIAVGPSLDQAAQHVDELLANEDDEDALFLWL